MPNPKGINQYSKGKGAGSFLHGTKSANSSNAGAGKSTNSRASAKRSAALAKKNAGKKR